MQPDCRLIYVIGHDDALVELPRDSAFIDDVFGISAGKFRRYHGEGWRQLLDINTMFKNIRDLFRVMVGFFQSIKLINRQKPAVIFIKGGFVGVPVGLAAALLGVPYITHDSDAIPGLANRLIGRWALAHAVTSELGSYPYKKHKIVHTGVPVNPLFRTPSSKQQQLWRQELGIGPKDPVLCVTGGGLGATRLNNLIVASVANLMADYPKLWVLHMAGPGKEKDLAAEYTQALSSGEAGSSGAGRQIPDDWQGRVLIRGFVPDLYRYSGVADVVVARAGANSLADFALQGRACVIVPNPNLTGGHQTKNAQIIAKKHAVMVVEEKEIAQHGASVLTSAIDKLLSSETERNRLSAAFKSESQPDAARTLTQLILAHIKINKDFNKKYDGVVDDAGSVQEED